MVRQVVLLLDLDRCLPLELGPTWEQFEAMLADLKKVCLRLLLFADSRTSSVPTSTHFSLRFYSSHGYFMVPSEFSTSDFIELTTDSFQDQLESRLVEKFEQLFFTRNSNDSYFNPANLKAHLEGAAANESGSNAGLSCNSLRRALEEIAILYSWDRPVLNSPVKTRSEQDQENVVYVLTRLPSTCRELIRFCSTHPASGLSGSSQNPPKFPSHRDVYHQIFGRITSSSGRHGKKMSLVELLKKTADSDGKDSGIKVFAVDTWSLHRRLQSQTCASGESKVKYDRTVKDALSKGFMKAGGGLIPFESLASAGDLISPSTVLARYLGSQDYKPVSKFSFRLQLADGTTVKMNAASTVDLNLEAFEEAVVIGSVPKDSVPIATIKWTRHYAVWPEVSLSSARSAGPSISSMRGKGSSLLVQFREGLLGLATGLFGGSAVSGANPGILSLMSPGDSAFCRLLLTDENIVDNSLVKLPEEVTAIIERAADEFLHNMDYCGHASPLGVASVAPPFRADCFEKWKIPESKPFANILARIKGSRPSCSAPIHDRDDSKKKRLFNLKRSYLPKLPATTGAKCSGITGSKKYLNERVELLLERRLTQRSTSANLNNNSNNALKLMSEDSSLSSLQSHSLPNSNGGGEATGGRTSGMTRFSRAAEMVILGNQKAEMRRNSLEEKASAEAAAAKDKVVRISNSIETEKRGWVEKFSRHIDEKLKLPKVDDEAVCLTLMGLQVQQIKDGASESSLLALAEVTICTILQHLEAAGRPKVTMEDVMCRYFLVAPEVVGRRKTSLLPGGRVRDHKLQILYRVEMHWLLACQKKQKAVEQDILSHLRQISIWDSPNETLLFLSDVLVSCYLNRQSDLLCLLYEELNQPIPPSVRALFSPTKSDCSSVRPGSTMSQGSDTTTTSFRSVSAALAAPHAMANHGSNMSAERLEKLRKCRRRPTSFDKGRSTLQINMPSAPPPAAALLGAAEGSRGLRTSNRVKRNLTFEDFVDCADGSKNSQRKSPRKALRPATSEAQQEAATFKTPKKGRQSRGTPCKLTPGKTHRIFVPETPKNKQVGRRKTDGVSFVAESPDLDKLKQAAKTTPLRAAASLSLRRKTSFYASGDVSRNVQKAEEVLSASHIQSHLRPTRSAVTLTTSNSEEDPQALFSPNPEKPNPEGPPDSNPQDSAQRLLFPHLMKKTLTDPKDEDEDPLSRALGSDNPPKRPDLSGDGQGHKPENFLTPLRKGSCPLDRRGIGRKVMLTPVLSDKLVSHPAFARSPTRQGPEDGQITIIRKRRLDFSLTEDATGQSDSGVEVASNPKRRREEDVLEDIRPLANATSPFRIPVEQMSTTPAKGRRCLFMSPEKPVVEPLAQGGPTQEVDVSAVSDKKRPQDPKILEEVNKVAVESATCEVEDAGKKPSFDLQKGPAKRPTEAEQATARTLDAPGGLEAEDRDAIHNTSASSELVAASKSNAVTDTPTSRKPRRTLSSQKRFKLVRSERNGDNPAEPEGAIVTVTPAKGTTMTLPDPPASAERPCRFKKSTARFGIDDVRLNEVVSPSSTRQGSIGARTPKSVEPGTPATEKKSVLVSRKRTIICGVGVAVVVKVQTDDVEKIVDRHLVRKKQGRRQAFLYDDGPEDPLDIGANNDSLASSFCSPIDFGEATEVNREESLSDGGGSPPQNRDPEDSRVSPRPLLNSPGKFWSVVSRTESPQGGIKIRINRKKKPKNDSKPLKSSSGCGNLMYTRVSRRMAEEVGVSPGKLLRLMTEASPEVKMRLGAPDVTIDGQIDDGQNLGVIERLPPDSPGLPSKVDLVGVKGKVKLRTSSEASKVQALEEQSVEEQQVQMKRGRPPSSAKRTPSQSPEVSQRRTKYSPLSSSSLYNLTMSPLLSASSISKSGKRSGSRLGGGKVPMKPRDEDDVRHDREATSPHDPAANVRSIASSSNIEGDHAGSKRRSLRKILYP